MLAPPSGSDRLAWNLLFVYEYPITVKECIMNISARCWLSLQEVLFVLLESMQVSLVPSGNLICMYHIVYRSTIKYLLKFPQHNALLLLSETAFLPITSNKSILFPAKHPFPFHFIPDEFLPIHSEYNLGCRRHGFLGPWLSRTHNFIHRSENQLQMWGTCCTNRINTTHSKRQQGKFIAFTATTGWQKQSLDLERHQEWPMLSYQKTHLRSSNPICTPQGFPVVCKRDKQALT